MRNISPEQRTRSMYNKKRIWVETVWNNNTGIDKKRSAYNITRNDIQWTNIANKHNILTFL
jgi:hypothetical protein